MAKLKALVSARGCAYMVAQPCSTSGSRLMTADSSRLPSLPRPCCSQHALLFIAQY